MNFWTFSSLNLGYREMAILRALLYLKTPKSALEDNSSKNCRWKGHMDLLPLDFFGISPAPPGQASASSLSSLDVTPFLAPNRPLCPPSLAKNYSYIFPFLRLTFTESQLWTSNFKSLEPKAYFLSTKSPHLIGITHEDLDFQATFFPNISQVHGRRGNRNKQHHLFSQLDLLWSLKDKN